jgi:hypothetical protein
MELSIILSFLLFVYGVVISVLYFLELKNKNAFQQETLNTLKTKETELNNRESIIVDKELCFRELTKLKTIHTSIQDILKNPDINITSNNKSTQ